MKSPYTFKTLLLGLLLLLTCSSTLGQDKINITAGVGFPELLHLGLRFQFEQSQLGLYGGSYSGGRDEVFSVGVDYFNHFGGSSNLSTRRPWYGKAGLNYYQVENQYDRNTYLLLVPRIGRDFNLSRSIGIALDGGLYFVLFHSEVEIIPGENPCWFCGGWYPDIAPSFSLSVFYRL